MSVVCTTVYIFYSCKVSRHTRLNYLKYIFFISDLQSFFPVISSLQLSFGVFHWLDQWSMVIFFSKAQNTSHTDVQASINTASMWSKCPNAIQSETMEGRWLDTLLVCLVADPCWRKNLPTIYTFLEIHGGSTKASLAFSTNWIFLFLFLSRPLRPRVSGFILFCSSTRIGRSQTEPV